MFPALFIFHFQCSSTRLSILFRFLKKGGGGGNALLILILSSDMALMGVFYQYIHTARSCFTLGKLFALLLLLKMFSNVSHQHHYAMCCMWSQVLMGPYFRTLEKFELFFSVFRICISQSKSLTWLHVINKQRQLFHYITWHIQHYANLTRWL